MKNIILTLLLITPFLLTSQDVDQEFLESLPETVRNDVIKKMEAKEKIDAPVYRRASTRLDKSEDDDKEYYQDKIFGEKFFDTIQSSFMPINEPNLDSSYILDFGDVLEVQLIGQKDSIETYEIKRDGSINIPDIGKLILSGLPLEEASAFVKAKISSTYIGTEGFVTLKNIRDITILIAGEAYNPGIYTLNGNSNILHALSMAGGIGSAGSYRNISLVRKGEEIESFDVYQAMIFGKINFKSTLRSGDSVVVKPISKVVTIESGVLRPGKYELNEEDRLSDLIRYASGLNMNADKDNIFIKSIVNGTQKTKSLKYNDIDIYNINDGDSIYITEYKINEILIQGAVINPGNYKVVKGTTLSQIIDYAGGYDDTAYPFGGYLENKKALLINEESKAKLYDAFLNNLIMNSAKSSSENSNLGLVLDQIKNSEVTGRVIAEFDLDVIKANSDLDTVLEDNDKIMIPNVTQQVYIQGEVSNPGAIRYSPGKDIAYYLDSSGGPLDNADIENLFVIHPNGETEILKSQSRLSFVLAEEQSQLIYPGSIIYIPQNANFVNPLETASIWAPIISSVALSLTSLSVLNNNNN